MDGINRTSKDFNSSSEKISDKENSGIASTNLGLDISTNCIGLAVLNSKTGALRYLKFVKLSSSKFEDEYDKAQYFRSEFLKIIEDNILSTESIKKIYIEEAAKKFSPGFSSAQTISSLCRFNGMISLMMYEIFGVKPTAVNVRSARKALGIKIDYKDKSMDTKSKILEWGLKNHPTFPWTTHLAKTGKNKGQTIYDVGNGDALDAFIICRGGQLLGA